MITNPRIILKNLIYSTKFFSNVFPTLIDKDFTDNIDRKIFKFISDIYAKYNKVGNMLELELVVDSSNNSIESIKDIKKVIEEIKKIPDDINESILLDSTEKWIKDNRFYRDVVLGGSKMLDGDNKFTTSSLQSKAEEINRISFKKSAGHDYIEDAKERFSEYGKAELYGIKTGIEIFDIATGNGMQKRKLTVIMAIVNSGKSLVGAHCAVQAMLQQKTVAIFSFEDGELGYGSRIDCNLMRKTQDEMRAHPSMLHTSFAHFKKKGLGRLKIKEYPPRGASSINIRAQLDEWRLQDGFRPDLIIIDAINIAAPSSKTEGTYMSGKIVAEDFRAIAVDYDCHVLSMAQLDRGSFGSTSVGMENSAESIGIPATADTMMSLLKDTKRENVRIMSILKSRVVNAQKYNPVIINCETEYQTLSDMTGNSKDKSYTINREVKEDLDNLSKVIKTSIKKEYCALDELM